jgi:hypothetical protein
MARSRHSTLIRVLALLSLFWVGFDIGAHGLLASDFAPLPPIRSCPRASSDDTGASPQPAPEHCFCHGISLGAVLPALDVCLAPAGPVLAELPSQVPCSDGYPFDHPPQLAA